MTHHPSAIDPRFCPLCGQPNRCAMEIEKHTGVAQGPCWCTQATLSSELLAQVPEAARAQACICASCVARSAAPDALDAPRQP